MPRSLRRAGVGVHVRAALVERLGLARMEEAGTPREKANELARIFPEHDCSNCACFYARYAQHANAVRVVKGERYLRKSSDVAAPFSSCRAVVKAASTHRSH